MKNEKCVCGHPRFKTVEKRNNEKVIACRKCGAEKTIPHEFIPEKPVISTRKFHHTIKLGRGFGSKKIFYEAGEEVK